MAIQHKTAEHRLLELQNELERWVGILSADYAPEKIMLFGSFARGSVEAWSDVDMIIIKDTDKPFLERMKEVFLLLRPRAGLDVLVYTPEEFANLCKSKLFFRQEILPQGKTIYERGC